jgi:hypothetical protein
MVKQEVYMGSARIWIHGLVAAFVGGAASAISSGLASMVSDPAHFNLGTGFWVTTKLMGITAILSGIITAAAYLKQSPVPKGWDGVERRGQRATA